MTKKKKLLIVWGTLVLLTGIVFFTTRYYSVRQDVAVYLPQDINIDLAGFPFTGNEQGAITIVEYSDFLCPFSRQLQATLDTLHTNMGTIFKHYFKPRPIFEEEPRKLLARAVLAAKRQNKYWEMKKALFTIAIDTIKNNPQFLMEAVLQKALETGCDGVVFTKDISSREIRDEQSAITKEADTYGVDIVPTLFINGTMYPGKNDFNYYLKIIVKEMNKQRKPAKE